jgi:hypothetical protein
VTGHKTAADPAYSQVKAGSRYRMDVIGAVLIAWERGLWLRSDGALLKAKVIVRPGEATLVYSEIARAGSFRARLVHWLLRI